MKGISIGLLGLGTVGTGVVKIIEAHQEKLMHQVGCPVEIKKVLVQDVNKERAVEVSKNLLTTCPEDILNDSDIDVD
jgi:homoserine dehydrogenase